MNANCKKPPNRDISLANTSNRYDTSNALACNTTPNEYTYRGAWSDTDRLQVASNDENGSCLHKVNFSHACSMCIRFFFVSFLNFSKQLITALQACFRMQHFWKKLLKRFKKGNVCLCLIPTIKQKGHYAIKQKGHYANCKFVCHFKKTYLTLIQRSTNVQKHGKESIKERQT